MTECLQQPALRPAEAAFAVDYLQRSEYERAAQAGDTNAMHDLGVLFHAKTNPPDHEAARDWWLRAADAGDPASMNSLGILY